MTTITVESLDREILDALLSILKFNHHLNERLTAMAKTLDDMLAQGAAILAQVTKNTDLDSSIITITNAFAAQLADLKAQLVAAGIDKAKLAQLGDLMQTLSDKAAAEGQLVADAITANTDQAAPVSDPTPAPPPVDAPPAPADTGTGGV